MKTFVIFDFDNTLIDTRTCMLKRYGEVSIKLGKGPLTREQIENSRFLAGEDALKYLFQNHYEEAVKIYKRIPQYVEEMSPEPNLFQMLNKLQKLQITPAIATNRRGNSLFEAIKYHNLRHFFKNIYILPKKGSSSENLPIFPFYFLKPKPAPECLEKLLEISGNSKNDTVYIGDSQIDFECSFNAGINFIGYKDNFSNNNFPVIGNLMELFKYL